MLPEIEITSNNSSKLLYEHNITDIWLDGIYDQLTRSQKFERPLFIEVDYNLTEINADFAFYLLYRIEKHINSSFGLFSSLRLTLFIISYASIIIFGLFSNFLMIFAFLKTARLRTFRNYYIINLAVSDILLCSICAPLTLFRFMDVKWDLGRILCKLGPGLQTTNALVCAFSITAIAVDRWHFIVNQGKDKKLLMSISIFLIWVVSFLIAVPSFIVNDEKVFQLKSTKEILYVVCEEIWFDLSFKYIYSIIVVVFQYVLPVIIIASTNYKICSFLHFHVASLYSHKFKRGFQRGQEDNKPKIAHESLVMNDKSVIVVKQNSFYDDCDYSNSYERSTGTTIIRTGSKKFTKSKNLLLLVSLCFAFCWLPLILLNIFLDFWPVLKNLDGMEIASVYLIGHLVAVSSCCMNPILYGLENTNFKNEIDYMVNKILGRPIADEAKANFKNVSKDNETVRESRRKRNNSSLKKPVANQNLNLNFL